MGVNRPEEINQKFADAYNEGNLEELLKLYEPTAIHVDKEGRVATGINQICDDLKKLLSIKGYFTSVNQYTIIHDNLALLQAHFILKDVSKETIIIEGVTSEVVRKQKDGSWKYVIDHPFSQHVAGFQ